MKYFTIDELCKTSTGISNVPNSEERLRLEELVDNVLDPLRKAFGNPVIVNSGFRCEAVNRRVGGVPTSFHRFGCAADIRAKNKTDNKDLFNLVLELGLPFSELIWEKGNSQYPDWIHVAYMKERLDREVIPYSRH